MANQNTIYVRIENIIKTEDTVANSTSPALVANESPVETVSASAATTPNKNVEKLAKSAKEGKSVAYLMAVQYAKQLGQAALANYGDLTGDYATQIAMQTGIEITGIAASMVANPVMGIAATVFSAANSYASYYIQRGKQDAQTALLRERTQTNIK